MLSLLEQTAARAPAAPRSRTSEASVEPPPPTPVTSGIELDALAIGAFCRRVQPILMNTCASCHASGRASTFKLTRVFGDAPAGGRTSQQNLAAVLAQLRPDQPLASPLLVMAASVHGSSGQPPLRNRQTPAYKALEEWVRAAVASAPHVQPRAPEMASAEPAWEERKFPEPALQKSGPVPAENNAARPVPMVPSPTAPASKPIEPADEFDPIIFNRQMHPQRKPEGER
jgi:hypothetical protein